MVTCNKLNGSLFSLIIMMRPVETTSKRAWTTFALRLSTDKRLVSVDLHEMVCVVFQIVIVAWLESIELLRPIATVLDWTIGRSLEIENYRDS